MNSFREPRAEVLSLGKVMVGLAGSDRYIAGTLYVPREALAARQGRSRVVSRNIFYVSVPVRHGDFLFSLAARLPSNLQLFKEKPS